MQPQNAVIMDQPIVEELQLENQPPPPPPQQNIPPPPPPVQNQPPVHQNQPPLVPVQQPPVQAVVSGQGIHRSSPPGFTNSKIMVNLKHYNGDTDAVQWWASFLAYITLQRTWRMAEWEAILVLPFYLCGIAEQWFEMIDTTTKSSLANIKLSFLNRFKQHKQEDIGLTYLRQQENEPVDQYLHQALNYNKTNSVSEHFLVKLAYRGLKPQIQQIVVPQNPVSMSDLLSKSITAEMTINMVQPQQSNVENSILKAVSSIEDKIMDKISQRLDSIAAISSNSNKQQSDYVPYNPRNNHANNYQHSQSFQVPTYNDHQPMMPAVQRQRPVINNGPLGSCIGCDKCTTYVTIGTTRTKALIDTGANISVMNRNLLDKTSYAKVPLQPGAMKQVIAANGNHVQVLGKLSITLHIGNKQFTQTVHILDQLHHSLILGVDFMRKNGAFINFQDCTLELKDNPNIVLSSITLNSGLVRTKKVVTLPKHSETLIQVSVSKQDEDSTVLLEPLDAPPQFLQNVVVAKCLVKIHSGKTFKSHCHRH
ncbi:unnamed protein product [Mytilus coruscus]|uniref:Peptidase A2 domain-containing protein n=1 Tax=Mytilus coruscus TaxID=42192 RepID=A0A6J8AU51_MYTCO|nr:unnamed protein product [Mytilus coruscus]